MSDNAWSYFVGECTRFVAETFSWIPAGLGDAGQWLENAKAKGLATSSTPAAGSVVVYGAGSGYSPYGHVAVVNGVNPDGTFNVTEQNYTAHGVVNTRVSDMKGVLGFILAPGQAAQAAASGLNPGAAIQQASDQVLAFATRAMWVLLAVALVVFGLFLLVVQDIGRVVKDHPELLEAAA